MILGNWTKVAELTSSAIQIHIMNCSVCAVNHLQYCTSNINIHIFLHNTLLSRNNQETNSTIGQTSRIRIRWFDTLICSTNRRWSLSISICIEIVVVWVEAAQSFFLGSPLNLMVGNRCYEGQGTGVGMIIGGVIIGITNLTSVYRYPGAQKQTLMIFNG